MGWEMNRRQGYLFGLTGAVLLFIFFSRSIFGSSPSTSSEPKWQPPSKSTPVPADSTFKSGPIKPPGELYTQSLVLAKLQREDISWLYSKFPDANTTIYTVDAEPDKLQIPKNKGREAMVYLTYMIDHYNDLPDISIFFHPHQYAWHNSDLQGQNFLTMLEMLNPAHVARVGYMPLRCQHDPGCPNWLHLDLPADQLDPFLRKEEKYFTSKVWWELHPGVPLPESISEPCCSQFALSRERIRSNPVSEYVRYRDWLLNTELDDEISGRWMEYSWQYLFTGQAEFCPSQNICFCDGYGICFGGDHEFQYWLDRRAKVGYMRMEADHLDESHSWPEKVHSLRKEADTMDRWVDQTRQNALERGKDPHNRADDCGREWREGDGW